MNIEGLAMQAEAKTNERLARLAAYKQSLVDELAEFRVSGGAVLEIADGQDTGDAPMLLHQGVKIDASLKPFHSLSPLPPGAACPSSALSAARVVQSFLSEHIEYQQ
ncbi:MAG TPA: hypothetical protein VHK27_04625 [Gammaproteobacteria bacterium]|nr:hypothetical protein [Gammaproteobacteria bacterium]